MANCWLHTLLPSSLNSERKKWLFAFTASGGAGGNCTGTCANADWPCIATTADRATASVGAKQGLCSETHMHPASKRPAAHG